MSAVPLPRSVRRGELLERAGVWLARIAADQGWDDGQVELAGRLVEVSTSCDGYSWVDLDTIGLGGESRDELRERLDVLSSSGYVMRQPVWSTATDPRYAINLDDR